MNRLSSVLTVVLGICAAGVLGCGSDSPGNGSDAGWTGLGGDAGEVSSGASYGRIAAGGGKVFVAFADSNAGGQLTVMSSSGSGWTPVGNPGFSPSVVDPDYLAIAVDASGTPWVAFASFDGSSNMVLTVMSFVGGSWVAQGGAGFATLSAGISLVVAGGAPYVGFVDASGAAHAMTLAGSSWTEPSGLDGASASIPTLGTDGTAVYLAYDDTNADKLVLAKLSGSSWSTAASTTIAMDDGWAPNVSVSKGSVWIGYYNQTSGAVVMQLVGGNLQSVGSLGSIDGGDSIEALSATVYDGVPYVAFDDESRDGDPEPRAATVKYWDGSQWTLYAGYPNPCDIEDTVITTDPSSGHLYLTYQDCNGFMAVDVH